MPDVWTFNPPKLKRMLSETGWRCGVEPRVIKPRDPEWTCTINTPKWYGDIYIHHGRELGVTPPGARIAVLTALMIGLCVGYFSGKTLARRTPDATSEQPPAAGG